MKLTLEIRKQSVFEKWPCFRRGKQPTIGTLVENHWSLEWFYGYIALIVGAPECPKRRKHRIA